MNNMVRRSSILLILSLSMALAVFSQGTVITLLHVNDTHSHLDAFGPKDRHLDGTIGGIARAATIIGTEKATNPNVLLLHAGDLSVGDPFYNVYFGVPEYQIMLQMGFDAMTVGNHEFDFGSAALNDVLSTAFAGGSFPLISANLDMDAFPALKTWIQPGIIREIGGVKIGIFGMTVPDNPTNNPAPVIVSDNLVPIIQHMADTLHAQGAQAVIMLSHLGIYLDKMVIPATQGIDFVVGGHDHYLFRTPVLVANAAGKNVPVFQAGEFYKNIGKLRFKVDGSTVTMLDYAILPVDAHVAPDPSVTAVINSLKEGIVAKYGDIYHTQIGFARHELSKDFDAKSALRGTPMGDLVTDAFRAKTGTPIAITALGLISEKLYAGPIVGADVFRSMSYGYDVETGLGLQLATLKISGAELMKGLEITLSQLEVSTDFFPQVSGMSFAFDPRKPVGSRILPRSVFVHCRPLNPNTVYDVTVNTGIAMLLAKLGVSAEETAVLPDFEYTVVKNYITRLRKVDYLPEPRIVDASIHCRQDRPEAVLNQPGLELPRTTSLSGNYPNPFNPSTVISYSLPASANVTLTVYNAIGQEVAKLVNGEVEAGNYTAVWNASGYPSGVYFYRLNAVALQGVDMSPVTETHKMLLMK